MRNYTPSRIVIAALVIFVLAACSSDGNDAENDTVNTDDPTDNGLPVGQQGSDEPVTVDVPALEPMETARYRLTFTSTWSAETHPDNFPSNPHFSGLIGAVHNEQVVFWEEGQIASDGLEVVAEVGGKSTFRNELNSAIADGKASTLIDAGGISLSPGLVTTVFSVSRDYPQVTIISMLAPSPDWFVGVHNLSLLNANGEFIEQQTVDLSLYDSGTDNGASYTSGNSDTAPREPISLFSSLDGSLSFMDGLPAIGQFLIEKIE